jgi:hypothetical protein
MCKIRQVKAVRYRQEGKGKQRGRQAGADKNEESGRERKAGGTKADRSVRKADAG